MESPSQRAPSTSRTLLSLLSAQVERRPDAIALRWKRGAAWQTTSWRALDQEARAFGAALIEGGVAAGDRVALLMRTRREGVIGDLGALFAGAVSVPIYPTLTGEQIAFIVRDSGARTIVVDDARMLDGVDPGLFSRVIVVDGAPREGGVGLPAFLAEGRSALARDGHAVQRRVSAARGDDVASIFYTSGTTGDPKGVLLTHAAFLFEVDAVDELLAVGPADEQLLFLPLAHIFGKILIVAAMRVGAVTALGTSMIAALDECEEVKPTFFGSVPRLFEKLQQVALSKVKEAGRAQEKIFRWAMTIGHEYKELVRAGRPVPLSLELQHRYADKLVFSKVRARFGSRLRFAISGAAPIDAALCAWFHAAGVLILEGYGLTETTAATNLNRPQAFRFGSVGRPIPGVEVRTDGDGEVLVRGPNVTAGYHGRDDETRQAIDDDGWFHTGDIGVIDDDGFLHITDRKKDLLVTAGGKNVAPQKIEGILLRSPLLKRAVTLGDRRPYLIALLVVDADAFRLDDALAGLDAEALSRDPRVLARVQAIVDQVNAQLSPFETIKRFALLPRDLSIERGELTPTFKVKRRVVEQVHRALVDALY